MRIKKYAAAFLTATTVIGSLAACKKTETPADATPTPSGSQGGTQGGTQGGDDKPTATPTPAATPIPDRDLGGIEIIIGDHWSPEEPAAPTNAQEEAQAQYRAEIMSKYNYKIQSKAVAGWGDMTDTCVNTITQSDPAAQIFELDYRFVAKPMSNGLFYDLATLKELDFSEDKWSTAVKGIMTKGSSIYGMRAGKSEPRGCLFWNKQLFKDAGLDPDLPYDLQKSGQWTWSKFEEICKTLTRDLNNDGVTDVYATVSQGCEAMQCLVASTGKDYFGIDASGKIFDNRKDSDVVAAMDFLKKLADLGYEEPQPADSEWNYFFACFQAGEAAMTFGQEYMAQPVGQPYGAEGMPGTDIGMVVPPKPDGASDYHVYVCDNIAIIPSCYDAETASKIAFGYNVYTMATPGYDDPDDWLGRYYSHFNDERAVEETIRYYNNPKSVQFLAQTVVPIVDGDLGAFIWAAPFRDATPSQKIEETWEIWAAAIDEANK